MDPKDNANLPRRVSGEGYQSAQPMRLADRVLGAQRHICAFFHNRNEEYRVLPFIKEGLDRGEKAFDIVDPNLREEHLERLSSPGIDVAAAEQSNRLEVRNWRRLFCGTAIAITTEWLPRHRK